MNDGFCPPEHTRKDLNSHYKVFMTIQIETLTVGPLEVNCYIVGCDEHNLCAVIDPGDSPSRILSVIDSKGWKIDKIILTHAHADHTGGIKKIKDATNAHLLLHKNDAELLTNQAMVDMAQYIGVKPSPEADEFFENGDKVNICPCLSFTVLHTPGHTQGGVCLLFDNKLITGDTLFHMSIGRSDLPGGDGPMLLNSIKTTLFKLPDDTTVYPGHGEPTSIGYEKANNPFLSGAFE